ncbi:MAG: gephyrin-like molybdotransferase Glp [Methylotetracoccus sp.]
MHEELNTIDECGNPRGADSMPVDVALRTMLGEVAAVEGREVVALIDAAGRVLARPIEAPRMVPPYRNSAVDGYAVHGDSRAVERRAAYRLLGTALAGVPYAGPPVGGGETVRVMTGAPMPPGTNAVVMQEQVEADGETIVVQRTPEAGANVRDAGEDMQAGDTVLAAGRWLTPADIGVLASLGMSEVSVRSRPAVAVLSTGAELKPPGRDLPPGAIYDSNRYALLAAVARLGVRTHDLGIAPDDPDGLVARLSAAARSADVILCSGGASEGDADFVCSALASLGRVSLWKIALKPGRPLLFGHIGRATFFGLPGNPVAALVTYYWLVKPVIERRMGIVERPLVPLINARCETPLRKKPGRMEVQRAVLMPADDGDYQVAPTGAQGSGMLRSMSLANALIVLPHDSGPTAAGARVRVLPLSAVI